MRRVSPHWVKQGVFGRHKSTFSFDKIVRILNGASDKQAVADADFGKLRDSDG